MDENEKNTNTNENENANEPADTGRDTEEIKAMISALNGQIESLKAELSRKEPSQAAPPADFAAYFAEFMTGKKK